MENTTVGIETCKTRKKTSIFIVNKRLKEDKVKFLIGHEKNKYRQCIITLYIEETLNTNISDTSNQLKQILVHNCFYILGETKNVHYVSVSSKPDHPPWAIFVMGEFPTLRAKKEFETSTPRAYKNELKPHPRGIFLNYSL